MMLDTDGEVESLLPPQWVEDHVLHEQYIASFSSCSRDQWETWTASPASRLSGFAEIKEGKRRLWRTDLEQLLELRQVKRPQFYPYKNGCFELHDFDFDAQLVELWDEKATSDTKLWANVLRLVAQDWQCCWSSKKFAHLQQEGRSQTKPVDCDSIPAAWIIRFRSLRCLPDTRGHLREPAELLLRTPDTEPLMGVEPFVDAELDTEELEPLLLLLGVRESAAGPERLLSRLRDLATVKKPPVQEVLKWYDALDRLVARARPEEFAKLRSAFSSERIVLASHGGWASLGQVFRTAGGHDVPGVTLIHPDAAGFSMWPRLGMAEQPTEDLVLKWVRKLPRGTVVDPQDRERLKSLLARFPARIWNECAHWLGLDGSWTPIGEFKYRVTRRSTGRLDLLFPVIKAATADLRMVPIEAGDLSAGTTLDLMAELKFRLDDVPIDLSAAEKRPWILALGQSLLRVMIDDEEKSHSFRAAATRLSLTVWQRFSELKATPYLDGVPAGEARYEDAIWNENCLLVREISPAKYTEPVIKELTRIFGDRFADAIRTCIDRDPAYIEDYLNENFELMPMSDIRRSAPVQQGSVPQNGNSEQTALLLLKNDSTADSNGENAKAREPAVYPGAKEVVSRSAAAESAQHQPVLKSQEPETEPTSNRHSYVGSREPTERRIYGPDRQQRPGSTAPKNAGGPTLMTQFAKQKGFYWDGAQKCYLRKKDDSCIVPANGPFQWEWHDAKQNRVWRFWVAEQSFVQGGVEVATEVWEMIKKHPEFSAMVLRQPNGLPQAVSGNDLMKMVEGGSLKLYPATYRIKKPL
jgi:hypothetical protein